MKVWCVPVNFPNPEEQPQQAEAALNFIHGLKGLQGICPHNTGVILLTFTAKEDARAAKWKLEEFTSVHLPIVEGTITADGKTLNCNRVTE